VDESIGEACYRLKLWEIAGILRNSGSRDHGSIGTARCGRKTAKKSYNGGVKVRGRAEMRAELSLVG
jgi:hypothetical protein